MSGKYWIKGFILSHRGYLSEYMAEDIRRSNFVISTYNYHYLL